MKRVIITLIVCITSYMLILGCQPNADEIRRIVREEMNAEMSKKIIKPTNVIGPYSPAVQLGRFLFVSGQIALDPATGNLKSDNIEVETKQVLTNLSFVMNAARYDSSHVVSATVYLKNMEDYPKMNQIYGSYFPKDSYPARVAVEVRNLPKQANVEISVIAYK